MQKSPVLFDFIGNYDFTKVATFILSLVSSAFFIWCVFVFEVQHGVVIEVKTSWMKEYQIPLVFWCGGLAFYFAATKAYGKTEWKSVLRTLTVTHISLLLIQYIYLNEAETVTSRAFQYYVSIVPVVLVAFVFFRFCTLFNKLDLNAEQKIERLFLLSVPVTAVLFLDNVKIISILLITGVLIMINKSLRARKLVSSLFSLKVLLSLLIVAGLLIKVGGAMRMGQMGEKALITNSDDGDSYFGMAKMIASGQTVTNHHSVGYGVFLSVLYFIAGKNIFLASALQAFILAFIPLLLFISVRKTLGDKTAVIAMTLSTFSQVMLFNSFNLARESSGALFVVLLLLLWKKVLEKSSVILWVFISLTSTALIVTDSVFLPILILFYICSLPMLGWKARAYSMLSCAIAVVGVVGFMWIFTGQPSIAGRDQATLQELMTRYTINGNEMVGLGIHPVMMVTDPVQFITGIVGAFPRSLYLLALKIWMDFKVYFLGGYLGGFDPLVLSKHTVLSANLNVYFIVLILLGIYTLVLKMLKESQFLIFAMLFLGLGHGIVYSVFISGWSRFRGTVLPLLLLFAASGLVFLTGKISQKKTVPTL